jgi:hypothetical protein
LAAYPPKEPPKENKEKVSGLVRSTTKQSRNGSESEITTTNLQLLLVLSDPSDLGMSVDDRRNGGVVDVTVTLVDDLDSGDTLLLGLVGKHGSEGDISDALDTLDRGVELVVDDDSTLVVELDADGLEVEVLGDGSSTDSNEDDVSVELQWERWLRSRQRRADSETEEEEEKDEPTPACHP